MTADNVKKSLKASLPSPLETDRLVLEIWDKTSAKHHDVTLDTFNNPTAVANAGDYGLRTHKDLDALVDSTYFKTPDLCPGKISDTQIIYMVRLKGEEDLIGNVSLVQRTAETPPDIGWGISELWMGKGYATEAARELLRLARQDLGMTWLMATMRVSNQPSVRVAEKIGLVRGPRVKSDEGQQEWVYHLPGMEVPSDMKFSFYGEKQA